MAAAGTPPITITNREAMDRMESAMMDARLYALLLRSVVEASGIEMTAPAGDLRPLPEDVAEQITFLSLKLEHATVTAFETFQEAL